MVTLEALCTPAKIFVALQIAVIVVQLLLIEKEDETAVAKTIVWVSMELAFAVFWTWFICQTNSPYIAYVAAVFIPLVWCCPAILSIIS
jgi:hypothetical protein